MQLDLYLDHACNLQFTPSFTHGHTSKQQLLQQIEPLEIHCITNLIALVLDLAERFESRFRVLVLFSKLYVKLHIGFRCSFSN